MRIILAGLGGMGQTWATVLSEHPAVEVVGYVEPDAERRARFAGSREVPSGALYSGVEEALSGAGAEALVDVTPPAAHIAVSGAALRAGLHVLTEKPLADSMAVARELAALSEGAGRVHMVAQNYRFQPIARTIRRLIAEGQIGRVGGVSLRFAVGARWDPNDFRVRMAQPLVLDMSIHHMDLLRACLGGDPEHVAAQTWNPAGSWYDGDAAVAATFGFGPGLVVGYTGNWAATGDQTGWSGEWHIEGERGGLVWDLQGLWLAHGEWTRGDREELPLDSAPAIQSSFPGQHAVLDEFLAAIEQGRPAECAPQDNLRSLSMVFGIIESARTGSAVAL